MRKRKKYNLTDEERTRKRERVKELVEEKQKAYIDKPTILYCDDKSHPLFTIKVTVDKPVAVCYYCSKMWILKDA